ncbi:MAG: NAD(P)H-hydrate dehydratase [Chitinophagaceae bacterium]
MQLLDRAQIKAWDDYTILCEKSTSIQLMEQAAGACFNWLMKEGYQKKTFTIFCGPGNNGGDGLVLARLLTNNGFLVTTYITDSEKMGSVDNRENLHRLRATTTTIIEVGKVTSVKLDTPGNIVIDALFGSGLNKPLTDLYEQLVQHINANASEIISIDIASGLFSDKSSIGNTIIKPSHTLSFQCYKLAFLMAENEDYLGQVHILDIGLDTQYLKTISPRYFFIDETMIKSIFKKRKMFAHKGDFGHAVLIAGSYGMIGAAVLAAKSCMRSGVGKLTCRIPSCGYAIMQTSLPEAMCLTESDDNFVTSFSSLQKYDAIGIGPGLAREQSNNHLLKSCVNSGKPMVLDADALFTLSTDSNLLNNLTAHSIITPHVKEFDRLFSGATNDFERMEIARQKANALQIIIVLKGRYTLIATPGGTIYFNTTGNPGMAKGGSGDVLTGIMLSFLAQGYTQEHTSVLSVFIHGRAADIATNEIAIESLMPSDSIDFLGEAIKSLY